MIRLYSTDNQYQAIQLNHLIQHFRFWGAVCLALLLGGVIYLQAPNGMFVFAVINQYSPGLAELLANIRLYLPEVSPTGVIRYQLADLLWAFSFSAVFIKIWREQLSWLMASVLGIALPLSYEWMQYLQWMPGTFDWWDCVAIVIGGTLAVGLIKTRII